MTREELKTKAKESLSGRYGEVIVAMLLVYAISSIVMIITNSICHSLNFNITITSCVRNIVTLLTNSVVGVGMMNYYLKISRNEKVEISNLFERTDLIVPYIILAILTAVFITLWSFLFIIPGIIAAFAYSQSQYIIIDEKDLKPLEIIKKSKEMMKGHKIDLFILSLSFIGWAILGVFTFGILYIWLIPYMSVTLANFYNDVKSQQKKEN